MTLRPAGTSWADDVEDGDENVNANITAPKGEEYVDADGTLVKIEYATNDAGKRVKITRRIKRTLQKSLVDHTVAERQKWTKFGQERGNKPGPSPSTTQVQENVILKIIARNKAKDEQALEEAAAAAAKAKKSGTGKVVCRRCKGEHFTAKCPYKDQITEVDGAELGMESDTLPPSETVPSSVGASHGGKYIPPSQRAGAARPGESMRGGGGGGSGADLPTLRVTNISEDTQENDLRELFGAIGRVARVYVGRDRETGAGKGFAFVSFEDRALAQKAIDRVNGKGYDNLILSVQWSQPRPEGSGPGR